MRLVVRRGVLQDGEGYTFTLTVLGLSGKEEGCASIRLSPNRPPLGGSCHLFPLDAVRALTTKVHFQCAGECPGSGRQKATVTLRGGAVLTLWDPQAGRTWRMRAPHWCMPCCCGAVARATARSSVSTRAVSPPMGLCCPLASHPTLRWAWPWWCRISWVLPWLPSTGEQGPWEQGLGVGAGAAACSPMASLCRSLVITLPEPPGDPLDSPLDLTHWLHSLTESMLPSLLKQADPQHVIEYSLALITVLNEVSAGVLPSQVGVSPEQDS